MIPLGEDRGGAPVSLPRIMGFPQPILGVTGKRVLWMGREEGGKSPFGGTIFGSKQELGGVFILLLRRAFRQHRGRIGATQGLRLARSRDLGGGFSGIVSDGKSTHPYRFRVRPPSFCNLQGLPRLVRGHLVADVVALIGSLDIVLGEVDR